MPLNWYATNKNQQARIFYTHIYRTTYIFLTIVYPLFFYPAVCRREHQLRLLQHTLTHIPKNMWNTLRLISTDMCLGSRPSSARSVER